MRLLLDTHVLIWAISAPQRLGDQARRDISSQKNAVFFSAASIWEIAIKAALRRSDFEIDPYEVIAEAVALGFGELAIGSQVAAGVKDLPAIHLDPFDRLLVVQAMAEPCILLTADHKLAAYSDLVRLV
ncbi:type II toxin-antitoxin system VapC family toxin [Bosea vaviloviae]|uniref:Twitching motility protein PilT n=1 Tax=Bosea vaviloviae TaxID=1526658 RepID=A0A1D7U816_9HYPH|nr:type II toxin-antitoxin system VapC family toxin [Bosea vaviloviae]AOO83512.1 twitching motility protein PilT [Bosea vaviloviae]